MQLKLPADVTAAMGAALPARSDRGLTALHELCRMQARLDTSAPSELDAHRATAERLVERLAIRLTLAPLSPGLHGGREPLMVSALCVISDSTLAPLGSALIEAVAQSVEDVTIELSAGDLASLSRCTRRLPAPLQARMEQALLHRDAQTALPRNELERGPASNRS